MTEIKSQSLKITFTIQEIKQIILDNIDSCQNARSELFMSRLKSYEELHYPLIKFYKTYKKSKPTMADKLCFVILLSYPKDIIEKLNDISDVKLFSHDNSDFIYKQELTLNHEEDDSERYDCICSYERLQTIHYVENKYSGITLQVGSECITKHNIISNEELKKFKETEMLLKEKQREIRENKPIGYYKEEKQRKKEEKQRKKEEKENEKKQKKINTGNFKVCYVCCINLVDIRRDYLCICNKCKYYNVYKDLLCHIIKKYGLIECENCNNNFIDIKQKEPYLCKTCKIQNKIMKCSRALCSVIMIVDIKANNVFCDDCEKKIIKCNTCKNTFIQNDCETKCKSCQFNYENKFVNKICVCCSEEMVVKEKELWRTYCNDCYVEVLDIIKNPPNCKCGLKMVEKTIRKEGINKGRKGLGCSNFPNGCNEFKML